MLLPSQTKGLTALHLTLPAENPPQLPVSVLKALPARCPRHADLNNPAVQAGGWLTRYEAEGVGCACNREHLLRLLKMQLDAKASEHAETQQAERPTSAAGGRRGGRRRGQQGRGAGGQGAAAAGQGGPHLPPRSVGEAPTLLLSAARGVAERMLSLPLDQVRAY